MGSINKTIAFLGFLTILGFEAHSQFNLGYIESQDLTVKSTNSLSMPTAGGFTNPQFSEIDLNQDGIQDLFVFDRAKNTWRTFLYSTTTNKYRYEPKYEAQFPSVLTNMALLRDYNCDGLPDIFDYSGGGFRVHRCVSENPWVFELETEAIISDYGSVVTEAFLLPGDVPAIIDIDTDGDLDILAFGNGDSENTIVFHENQSQDQYGNCDSLEFVVSTACWGGFQEPPNSSELEAIACRPEISSPINWQDQASRFHPGSTIFFDDTDGDGDYDIALGDIQTKEFVFANNVGDNNSPEIDISTQTTDYPNATNPVNMQYMTAAYGVDIDHDGIQDLLATTNNRIDSSCNADHVWSYINKASIGAEYDLSTKSFLLGEMIDLGTGVVPLVFDVDGDGLNDMLLASDFYRSPTEFKSSRLHFYKNIGSSQNPSFELQNDDYASLSTFNFRAAMPALGDIDNDGDKDMIIGDAAGNLHLFENTEVLGVASFTLVGPNYMGINTIGADAAPSFADLNEDGALDLLVGERTGVLSYFENTGTAEKASFASGPTIENFGRIDVSFFCCNGYAKPQIIEQDEFGAGQYLFVGSDEKRVFIYEIGTDLNDSFALVDTLDILADRVAPCFTDLDGDGIIEMLVGTGEGGVKYFDRDENYTVGTPTITNNHIGLTLFPNPASRMVQLEIENTQEFEITVTSLDGRTWLHQVNISSPAKLDVSSMPRGVYFIVANNQQAKYTGKLIVNR